MGRFRNWRSERRIASRDTSPNVRTVPPPARAPATALVPSAQAELSDGVVVDAHVRGRLLGINLLYLHARVNIAPAVMLGSAAALPPERSPAGLPAHGGGEHRPSADAPSTGYVPGRELAEADRLLDDAEHRLSGARQCLDER